MAERLDRTSIGDRTVDLPCCSVFEMQGGKIQDMADFRSCDLRARRDALEVGLLLDVVGIEAAHVRSSRPADVRGTPMMSTLPIEEKQR